MHKRLVIMSVFILMLFALIYIYDTHPLRVRVAELHEAEIKANKKLFAMTARSKIIQPEISGHLDKNELRDISQFISFIQSSGLIIQASDLRNNTVHITLSGNYSRLFALIQALEKQQDLFALQDFSYKLTENNDLLATMDVSLLSQVHSVREINNHEDKRHNPFCITENINKWLEKDDINAALSVPIERIKMVGFLQHGSHSQALVMLPDSVMRTVEPGFLLGSEKGVVIAVHRSQTLVELPGGRTVALNLFRKDT